MEMNDQQIKDAILATVHRATTEISEDVRQLMQQALDRESNDTAKRMLSTMLENLEVAKAKGKGVCQSPGYPTSWIRFDAQALPPNISDIVMDGLGEATRRGYLRPSMVDPLTRKNSGNNTGNGVPNIEYEHCPGLGYLDYIISLKGCGAELGNAMQILTPAKLGRNLIGLKQFILETVINAGGKPCPPFGIGIGIGGQMDVASKLSRRAISVRKWNDTNPDPELAALEEELLEAVNSFGLGAAGTGGDTTALALKIERVHTHTAIAPVAVNFHCWVARRAGVRIYPDGRTEKLL